MTGFSGARVLLLLALLCGAILSAAPAQARERWKGCEQRAEVIICYALMEPYNVERYATGCGPGEGGNASFLVCRLSACEFLQHYADMDGTIVCKPPIPERGLPVDPTLVEPKPWPHGGLPPVDKTKPIEETDRCDDMLIFEMKERCKRDSEWSKGCDFDLTGARQYAWEHLSDDRPEWFTDIYISCKKQLGVIGRKPAGAGAGGTGRPVAVPAAPKAPSRGCWADGIPATDENGFCQDFDKLADGGTFYYSGEPFRYDRNSGESLSQMIARQRAERRAAKGESSAGGLPPEPPDCSLCLVSEGMDKSNYCALRVRNDCSNPIDASWQFVSFNGPYCPQVRLVGPGEVVAECMLSCAENAEAKLSVVKVTPGYGTRTLDPRCRR